MKSGVTLQQMLTEVKRQSESKEDYLIAPNRLRMESYGKEMFLHLSDNSGTELIEPMTITGIAHRQIGTHLRIPAAYYDRMREERPDLLAYNANTWFKQESSQRMLRTLDGSARAYLSNRYRRIDNIDIAGVTLPILGGLPDIRFESCQITESRMYIDTRKFFSICPPVWSMYRQDSHMAVVIPFRFSRGIARVIHSTNS